MNEVVPNIFDDEEITEVRRRPAEVVALRKAIYLVVSDCPDAGIQEIDSSHYEGDIILEDETANEYFTFDLSKAAVFYTTLIPESGTTSESDEPKNQAAKDIVFVDGLSDGLGLSNAEQAFFQ